MNTANNNPGNTSGNSQWKKEQATPGMDHNTNNKGLETNGPNKSKPFNVLNPDGSLADLPDGSAEGSGALDGTVGLGT